MQVNQKTGKEITNGSVWSKTYPEYSERLRAMSRAALAYLNGPKS